MSTITLSLPSDTVAKLRHQADTAGLSLETYLDRLADSPPRRKSFEEIAEPFRKGFEASGMTDEELIALVEDVREEIWQEKQGRKTQ